MSREPRGPNLPFPATPSASTVGRTLQESQHQWREEPRRIPDDAPNIVIFITDDSGFSNMEAFGGPVRSPTMTRLRDTGITYNAFHTTAMCSPTRAALLTGRNHHRVGSGIIAEFASDFDGYVGEIPRSAATMARVLTDYGYDTAAFGKWHNTPITHLTQSGPFDLYPTGAGFNYFYGFLAGETSQYEPRLFENTTPVEPEHHDGYHLTEDLAQRTIRYIRNNRALTPDKPLFLYVAPGAVHGPHHVASDWADRYKGKFDAGWGVLRKKTFVKQKKMGWIPQDAELTPIPDTMQKWADVPSEQREFQTRLMEVYAGFLEHTDEQYGKIVDELAAQGILDNTIIFYIGSDNGASAEGQLGTISELLAQNNIPVSVEEQMAVLERDYGGISALGGPKVDSMYHHGWAWAGDTPFKSTKLVAAHFGGTRTPLVISWPKSIPHDATPRPQFHHVTDIAPTVYDIVGIDAPYQVDGFEQDVMDGVSMVYSFADASAPSQKQVQYFDIYGSRGVYEDGWFACTFGPRAPWNRTNVNLKEWNPDKDVWELYHLPSDYSQANDLASMEPSKLQALRAKVDLRWQDDNPVEDKLQAMKDRFTMEATENKVFPIGGAFYTSVLHPDEIRSSNLTEWTLYQGQARIPESMAPRFTSGVSSIAKVTGSVEANAEGVLYCVGGLAGGFAVFLDNGVLKAEYNTLGIYRYQASASAAIPAGAFDIEVHLIYGEDVICDDEDAKAPAMLTLFSGGVQVGQTCVKISVPAGFTASETFDVGTDLGSPVSLDYYDRAPFPFTGTIDKLHIAYVNPDGTPIG